MKFMIQKYSIWVVLISSFSSLKAQDPQFSQFYNNSLYYNPSTIGILYHNPSTVNSSSIIPVNPGARYVDPATSDISSNIRFTSSYRKQWRNIPGDLSNYYVSVDYLLLKRNKNGKELKKNIGIGFLALSDNEGLNNLSTQRFETMFTYRLRLNNTSMLQFGMTIFSLNTRGLKNSNFVFTDQLDPLHGVVQQSSFIHDKIKTKTYSDWNVGMTYRKHYNFRHKNFLMPTLGFSVSHITRPNISLLENETHLPIKFVVHSSFLTRIKGHFMAQRRYTYLNPGFIYENQEQFNSLTIGVDCDMYPARLGIWFRNNRFSTQLYKYNSVIVHAGAYVPFMDKTLLIDYTFDSTVSKLEFASGGSHELTLQYNISWNKCK